MNRELRLTLDEDSYDAMRVVRLRAGLKDNSEVIGLALRVLYNLQLQAERGYTQVCAKRPKSDEYMVFTTLSPLNAGKE